MKQQIDSLIFDMDGTLWDAVSSYCAVWDETIKEFNINRTKVERQELLKLMGKPLGEIYDVLIGDKCPKREEFLQRLFDNENTMMPELGGVLYDSVAEVLERLHLEYKLFLVSNCSSDGLNNFLNFTGLRKFFIDTLTFGETKVDKDVNIRRLIEQYDLKRAVYVGDIQRDADSTHIAGIEFVWAAYGFGNVANAEFRIDSFNELETKVLRNGN